jgi:hypothetical protein
MDKSNSTRVLDERQSKNDDYEVYLKAGLQSKHVEALLKSQGKSDKEIQTFMEKYDASKRKISKLIKKFVEKIELRYGHLDTPELMKKGIKFAAKHNFTSAEKEAFIRFVLKGDTDGQYLPFEELGYTEMSKFLGFSSFQGEQITVKPTDQNDLNEIARLYEMSKPIHSAIRNNIISYKDCDQSSMGEYDKKKNNINMHINPLIVALFLAKIEPLEKRMLASNFGRLVISRTIPYFQTQQDGNRRYMNWSINQTELLPFELPADMELAVDIARDPNSLNYFSDESPMKNLCKRFLVQIELWKNVLSLRNGRYYSTTDNFNVDDGITGLVKVLSTYDWTYFDSPDLYQLQDEGTLLRKLLAVFSYRPTFTQISAYLNHSSVNYTQLGVMSKATFINTPICNIRLPASLNNQALPTVDFASSLTQNDWFIENKMLVPKNKTVIKSRVVLFFYVNRRQQSINAALDFNMSIRYMSIPGALTTATTINTTPINCDNNITLGNETFELRSAVLLNTVPYTCNNVKSELSAGSTAVIKCIDKSGAVSGIGGMPRWYEYKPLAPNGSGAGATALSPLYLATMNTGRQLPDNVDTHGTIYVYVDEKNNNPC